MFFIFFLINNNICFLEWVYIFEFFLSFCPLARCIRMRTSLVSSKFLFRVKCFGTYLALKLFASFNKYYRRKLFSFSRNWTWNLQRFFSSLVEKLIWLRRDGDLRRFLLSRARWRSCHFRFNIFNFSTDRLRNIFLFDFLVNLGLFHLRNGLVWCRGGWLKLGIFNFAIHIWQWNIYNRLIESLQRNSWGERLGN